MVPASLLTTLLLALAVAANPVLVDRSTVKLPFTKHINITNARDLVQRDQARARALKNKGSTLRRDAAVGSPAINQAVQYIASVGVGSPPTSYNLVVDTGSSNTWIGAGTAYKQTSTSSQTSDSVSVTYGSGSFSGTEFTDQVTIASGLVISQQSIGVASTASGFSGVDGIIGIGPADLTVGTLSPDQSTSIPTVTDNLFSTGTIPANVLGISFEPITDTSGSETNGEITWGATDSSKFSGSITFTPVTGTSPANQYWGIDQSIHYGSTTILSSTAGIVDTGTTLTLIATDAFQKYQSATGGVLDSTTGLLTVTSSKFAKLKTLNFVINGATFGLTPNAQIWPRNLNSALGGTAGNIYLIVADIGSVSGTGLDFINGQTFLERFYSVFDTANQQIGLATTSFTSATTN